MQHVSIVSEVTAMMNRIHAESEYQELEGAMSGSQDNDVLGGNAAMMGGV